MLTAFRGEPSEPPSFCWTVRFRLTGDSGCPRAGTGAGWDGAFFPDGSSLVLDEGLLTPAVCSAGMRCKVRAQAPHAGFESPGPSPPTRVPWRCQCQLGSWSGVHGQGPG